MTQRYEVEILDCGNEERIGCDTVEEANTLYDERLPKIKDGMISIHDLETSETLRSSVG